MADRVASDHASISTLDATIVAHGATSRPAIELPEDADVPSGELLRLVVDGTVQFTVLQSFAGDSLRISGAYDAPGEARSPGDATNRLRTWLDDTELSTGRTVHIDVIDEGFKYGLRAPGERVVYDAPASPSDSLASIASQLEANEEDGE
jgi:hypothetical protein